MSNRRNPVRFAVDFANRQIVGTETSLKKARRYGSDEYHELCKLMEAHPQFAVAKKEVEHSKSKKTYKNLDFTFIETYISIQASADALKKEYEEVKKVATSLNIGVYPHTKSWFLKKFGSEEKPFDMDEAREEISSARLAAAQVGTAE